jgi:hypothetical protein
MGITKKVASRRRILKGMGQGAAVTVGIPYLDCFLNANGTASADTGKALPVVYSTWHWGLGFIAGRWEPKGATLDELPEDLRALEKFKKKINIYSGLKVHLDGRPALTHFTGNIAQLTGEPPTSDVVLKASLDTVIADHIGTTTRFKSLEMSSTGNPKHMYSFRAGGVFQAGEGSPLAMYARIFGPEFRDPNAADFRPDPAVMARQSVLSAIKEQRRQFEAQLGASDRARLDEYFTSLRQLERQLVIQLEKPAPLEACRPSTEPAATATITQIEVVKANHKAFAQLAAHAFACDQTRVVNLVYSDMASSLRTAGSQMTHHIFTHEESIDEKLGYQPIHASFLAHTVEALAHYMEALDSIQEGDKTLLDRALVYGVTDTGYARVHGLENIPVFTAGAAGGRMRTGRHVSAVAEPVTRAGLTVMQVLGLPIDTFGTSSMQTSRTITEVLT